MPEFAAKPVNQEFDRIALYFFTGSVDPVLDLSTRENRSRPQKEGVQQREFPRAQHRRDIAAICATRSGFEEDDSIGQYGGWLA